MDELIDRIVTNVGVDRPVAEQSVGIILDYLIKEGPSDKVQTLLGGLNNADVALQAARSAPDLGGMFNGLGGIMGVGTRLMALNLGMNQIRSITQELMTYSREKAGEEAVNEIVASIPALRQFS
jgi:hypothetical protein